MGFFSQDCNGCGHPLLSMHATNHINLWMNEVVAIQPDGAVQEGFYDGYGRIYSEVWDGEDWIEETYEEAVGFDATVWHQACWALDGEPTVYLGPSEHSEDQGFFFRKGTHDMPLPLDIDQAYCLRHGEKVDHVRRVKT
jgi:hypothetical protein